MDRSVLLVDDDLETLELVGTMLERSGYRILAARSGLKALQMARLEHPDLILLDIMMPGMDGYEVLEILKADQTTNDIPVVIFSARGQVDDQLKGMEAGAVDYIPKPAQTGELVMILENALQGTGE
ncbi:MAG: response regulator [Chloroflexi bacterium]|nr:response regulator [Chloroflexota bacterium]